MEPIDIDEFFKDGSSAYLIGINAYKPPVPPLNNAVSDVQQISTVLHQDHGFKIDPVVFSDNGFAVTLNNPLINPTTKEVIRFLSSIKAKKDERVVIYFAGHGLAINNDKRPQGFLLAADAESGIEKSFISMDTVREIIDDLDCKHLLVILDCCYAGAFRWGRKTRGPAGEVPKTIYYERFEQYTKHKTLQVLTSAAHDQKSFDTLQAGMTFGQRGSKGSLSPFAKLFVDGIRGKADSSYGNMEADGIITITEIGNFLQDAIFKALHHANVDADDRQLPSVFPIIDAGKKLFGKGEFVFLNPAKQNIALPHRTDVNPYKGLFAYNKEDASIFYGRQRVLDGWYDQSKWNPGLIELSKQFNFIIITGSSGIGKSSLAKAGIMSYYEVLGWQCLQPIRPGITPYTTNRAVLESMSAGKQVLLIDQYEELVTVCTSETEKRKFENAVVAAGTGNLVLITIRSDFENQFKGSPVLRIFSANDKKKKYRFAVPPFLRDEIREIVVQPAAQQILEFSPVRNLPNASQEFVNRMIDESFRNPGSLPLLSLALSELYNKRDGNKLLESEYNKFGGITGILDKKASNEYSKLTGSLSQQLFRQLIFRMISFESGLRSKRRIYTDIKTTANATSFRDELNFSHDTNTIKSIANKLIDARLVTADSDEAGKTFIEPNHDALLRSWGLLSTWLKAEDPATAMSGQEIIQLLKSVSDGTASYYDSNEADKDQYLRSWASHPRLLNVKQSIPRYLNVSEHQFVQKAYDKRMFLRRVRVVSLVIFGVIVATLGTWGWIQQSRSAREANRNKALYLASVSDRYGPTEQLSILKAAYSISPDSAVEEKMVDLLESYNTYDPFAVAYFETDSIIGAVFANAPALNTSFGVDEVPLLIVDSQTFQSQSDTLRINLLSYKNYNTAIPTPPGFEIVDTTGSFEDSTINIVFDDNNDSGKYIFANFDKFRHLRKKIEFDKKHVNKVGLIEGTSFFTVHTEDSVRLYDATGRIRYAYFYKAYDDIQNVITVNDSCYALSKNVVDRNYVIHSLADNKKIVVEYKDLNLTKVQSLKYNNDTFLINFISEYKDDLGNGHWSNLYIVNIRTRSYTDIQFNGFPTDIKLSPSKEKLIVISDASIQVVRLDRPKNVKTLGFDNIVNVYFPGDADVYAVTSRSAHGFTIEVFDQEDIFLNSIEYSVEPASLFLSADKNYLGGVFNNRKILIWKIGSYAGLAQQVLEDVGIENKLVLDNFSASTSGRAVVGDFGARFKGCMICDETVRYVNGRPFEVGGIASDIFVPLENKDSLIITCPDATTNTKTFCIADIRRFPYQIPITKVDETILLKELADKQLDFVKRGEMVYVKTKQNNEYLLGEPQRIFGNWSVRYYFTNGKLFKQENDTVTIYSSNDAPELFVDNLPRDDYFGYILPMNEFSGYYQFLQLIKQKRHEKIVSMVQLEAQLDSINTESILDFVQSQNSFRFTDHFLVVKLTARLMIFDLNTNLLEDFILMTDYNKVALLEDGMQLVAMKADGSFIYIKTKRWIKEFLKNGYTIPVKSIIQMDL